MESESRAQGNSSGYPRLSRPTHNRTRWHQARPTSTKAVDEIAAVAGEPRQRRTNIFIRSGWAPPGAHDHSYAASISPCLANLFLHYGLDAWMVRELPTIQFERFADDAVIHCVSERQARQVRDAVARRLVEVGLELHPDKTRIVYCKDSKRRGTYEEISFTFCGYTFRPRRAYNQRTGEVFTGFLPAASPEKLTAMSRRVASWRLHRRTNLDLSDLAPGVNLVLRGWLAYFTAFNPTAVIPLCQRIDRQLMRWARCKYKRLARSPKRARAWLQGLRTRNPELFVHWRYCGAVSSNRTARAV